MDNPWLDEHIHSKGPLGAQYPHTEYLMEGDTPTFLNMVNNGLSDLAHPDWGGWGGRYEFYTSRIQKWFPELETRPFWTDVVGVDGNWHTTNKATIWCWCEAYQNDFATRMDWIIKPYDQTSHPPVPTLNHANWLTPNAVSASTSVPRRQPLMATLFPMSGSTMAKLAPSPWPRPALAYHLRSITSINPRPRVPCLLDASCHLAQAPSTTFSP